MSSSRPARFLAGAACLTYAAGASADSTSVTAALTWERLPAAETCLDGEALARRVDHQLGRVAIAPAREAELAIDGHVDRSPGNATSFHAVITSRGRDGAILGVRSLTADGPECSALEDAATLVIALMIDPEHALLPHPLEDSTPPSPAMPPPIAEPAAPTLAEPDHPTAPVAPRPWHAEIRGTGAVVVGLAPSAAPGFRVAATVLPPRLPPVELAVAGFPAESATATVGGGSFSILEGSLAVCPTVLRTRRLRGDACAGVAAAAMRAAGFGFSHDESHTEPMVSLDVGARLAFRVAGPWLATAGVRGLVPFVRPDFTYSGGAGESGAIYQPAAIAGAVEIGLGAQIF